MQTINKTFFITILLIFVLLIVTLLHYIFFDRDSVNNKIDSIVGLTTINSPAYSTSWHEQRLRGDEPLHYSPYPEMPTADRLTFIYKERKSE
jgi:hypothetical protein